MPSVYNASAFKQRVNYAAACIVIGGSRTQTRHFDTCFEMYDGRVVAVALARRAANNPKLKAALERDFSTTYLADAVAEFAHVPTRGLEEAARAIREDREAADAMERDAQVGKSESITGAAMRPPA